MQDRGRGTLIALAGVIAVSPDAMLLRWMRSLGAASPDVAVAKYLGIIVFTVILGIVKGAGRARESVPHFLASALCQLAYQLSFTFCLLLTDAAKALLLISLAPLWAALLGRVILHEPLPRRTVIALFFSVLSIGIVFTPRLLELDSYGSLTHGPGSLFGDLLAVVTGVTQGASLTVNRHAALHRPTADLTLATALSSVLAVIVASNLPCYDNDTLEDAGSQLRDTSGQLFWACTPPIWHTVAFLALGVCDAVAVALFYVSQLTAPRYITGGEVALITLLEVIIGPAWVFLRFGERPSIWTLAGGSLLLLTLASHEWSGRSSRTAATQKREAGVVVSSEVEDDRPYHSIPVGGASSSS